MSKDQFLNLLAFLILMGNEKILSKSPDYILEKFQRYVVIGNTQLQPNDKYRSGLDNRNVGIFVQYINDWSNQIDAIEVAHE